MEIFQTDSDIPVTILRAELWLGLFLQEIFNTGYKYRSSGKVWCVQNHQNWLYFWSKDQTQINNPHSPVFMFFIPDFIPTLIQSTFHVTKTWRDLLPVPSRLLHKADPSFPLPTPTTPTAHIQKNIPYLSHAYMMPFTAFCCYSVSFFLPDNFSAISKHLDVYYVIAISMGYQVDFWKFCLWKEDSHQSLWLIQPLFSQVPPFNY